MQQQNRAIRHTLEAVAHTAQLICPYLHRTPNLHWRHGGLHERLGPIDLHLKLELFQVSGSFKARGVLSNVCRLSADARARGITGFSSGNHAVALAYAGQALGIPVKVAMIETANPARRERARRYGAELVFAPDAASAKATAEAIAAESGMTFVHPFEGPFSTLGTGTLGLEIHEDFNELDAVVIAIGAGSLAGGVSATLKLCRPEIEVFGVEPMGSDVMRRSLDAGEPVTLTQMRTIADSLAPPFTGSHTFALCRDNLTDVVTIDDDAMREAMRLVYNDLRLAVEPGGVAALAGVLGPLRSRLAGKRVLAIVCGSNIDLPMFSNITAI
jgi:threonine dehydratase